MSQATKPVTEHMATVPNLDATVREIEAWFFNDYVPTWVKAALRNEGETFIFQYYSVPMYWNALGVNDWLATETAVRDGHSSATGETSGSAISSY